ncbi:MAG: hypothetical protein ABIQ31_02980 [Ferruginibacter sp.]
MQTILKDFSLILKQEGTSRKERYLPALHETSKLLDDRKLEDFIYYMHEYSKNLLFINTENDFIDFEETWEDFFKNEPGLVVALIARANSKKVKDKTREDYDRLSRVFKNDPTVGTFATLARFVFSRFAQINQWYVKVFPESIVKKDLNLYILSHLQKEMESLREILVYCFDHQDDDIDSSGRKLIHGKADKSRVDLEGMDPIWKLEEKEKTSLREKIFSGDNLKSKLQSADIKLYKAFEAVFHVTELIAEKSGKYFEDVLHKQDHNPHVALIVTFIKLFSYQQAELNKIPEKLLKFYYKDVLRIAEKPAVPDQAFIVFELTKGFDTYLMKKGTKLSAGNDKSGNELIYESDKDVVLNKAKISAIRTAFIDRQKTGEVLNYYTDTIVATPGQVIATSLVETRQPGLFGEINTQAITETGFAIASSQLYLAKGERNIIITLNAPKLAEPPAAGTEDEQAYDLDKGLLKLLLTGEKGWISSDDEASKVTITSIKKIKKNDVTTIEINFVISIKQEQAIVAFDKKLHEGDFNTNFPVVQFILKFPSEKEVVTDLAKRTGDLDTLQKFQVAGAGIKVLVGSISMQSKISFDGVKDLLLENDEGLLDNKKPFYPFTAMPKVGGSFYLGCEDLFYKDIQDLSVNIDWLLPDNFKDHYKKYNAPYDTNKFMVTLSRLTDNRWKKYADVPLIIPRSTDPRLRIIKMDLDRKIDLPDDEIATFDSVKKNGTLKLKLRYPDFGHSVYPQLITATVMDKASTKTDSIDYYDLVKKRLHDDVFTIELPPDLDKKDGSVKVMYTILDLKDDDQARVMLVNVLSDIISKKNGIDVIAKKPGLPVDAADEKDSTQIVHDQNFLEKVLRFFRKLKLIGDVHHDPNKQGVGTVVDDIDKHIYKVADFILPSKKEMINLITNEVNKIITQTVAIAVESVIDLREKNKNVDPAEVAKIFRDEFDKTDKVINDMIAKKIAVFLSTNEIPPPPYSPLINSISLNYSSSKPMSRVNDDKFFHLTVTGGIIETSIWKKDNMKELPAVRKQVIADTSDEYQPAGPLYKTNHILPQPLEGKTQKSAMAIIEGMLFIGITDMQPNQNLSLLFQLAEGTKNNDLQPPEIYWFYLRHNEWINIDKDDIISDSTHDLQTTGIIEFAIPEDADNLNTLFDVPAQYWLCAGVAANANAFPSLTDVKAQAAGVTFVDYRNNPQHMALPLEAQKIKIVIDDIPQIKKISQPASSFNGKVGEKENEYYLRVSERLRHKGRAISNWDYENLVLEQFPSLYKVKCLNNYYNSHFAVGHVTIVPIADLRNKNYAGSNILVPKINYVDLKNIESFLSARASRFVKIHAVNPKLEHIQVKCKVKFYTGISKGFYLKQLNDDLVNFLTPWATNPDVDSFSGKVYASSIINFIDQREYVDYVQDLEMLQYVENDKGEREYLGAAYELEPIVETELTTLHSILVSAPRHDIELVEEPKKN